MAHLIYLVYDPLNLFGIGYCILFSIVPQTLKLFGICPFSYAWFMLYKLVGVGTCYMFGFDSCYMFDIGPYNMFGIGSYNLFDIGLSLFLLTLLEVWPLRM